MADRLPLPTLLSQALVAFTVEFDNEAETRMAHRTTTAGAATGGGRGVWLVSLAMWANFMQFVSEEGIPFRDLEGPAKLTNLAGLQRWGYITFEPDPADTRPKPPRADWVVRPTRSGRRAQRIWGPLAGEIERRWEQRFGSDGIARLRGSLESLIDQFDVPLPRYLPVVHHGMFTRVPPLGPLMATTSERGSGFDLSVLLSQVLLAFTLDFERESKVSLVMCADALRLLDGEGVRVRDLPRRAGVSKEGVAMMVGYLERRGFIVVERDPPDSRTNVARLTPKGEMALNTYRRLLEEIQARWTARFGTQEVAGLRADLEDLVGDPSGGQSPLLEGLQPPPDGWRASVPRPATLPHHPMVLHRGGYPDGS
ncbi:MAG TPA: MarR family winged helix-turn-helix transcriptional regulator [Acidimicrobiales bacterium]|nr:MarR family winged helix-turn-helix transcriptional regulator [Acidimicrobiales bacterium]